MLNTRHLGGNDEEFGVKMDWLIILYVSSISLWFFHKLSSSPGHTQYYWHDLTAKKMLAYLNKEYPMTHGWP
jgi:hypothetical protein